MTEWPYSGQLPLELTLEDHAVLDTFHAPGAEALLAAARHPPAPGLWITGPEGCGKSHLLQAICAHLSNKRVAYVPLGTAPSPAMLENLDRLDVVCIDDVQVAAGDPEWERALFNLVNGLALNDARLITSATGGPDEIGIALPDLTSRFQALVRYRLRRLDDEGRLVALRRRAAFRGLELPADTAEYLLRRMPRDMRRLNSVLDELDTASLAASRRLTIPFVRRVLGA